MQGDATGGYESKWDRNKLDGFQHYGTIWSLIEGNESNQDENEHNG